MAEKKTKQDIENMSERERTWESLMNSYGQQKESSNAAYDQEISKQDNSLLSRGMNRSSYGASILANLRNQKVKAANTIDTNMLSAYSTALNDIENREREQSNWEKTFAENQRQFNETNALNREQFAEQKAQNAWNQNFQQAQFNETKAQNAWNQKFQQEQADIAQQNTLWNQNFQQNQFNYQKERDLVSDAQWQKNYEEQLRQFNENMAYQKERANVSDAQWEQEYQRALDEFNQNMAYQRERAAVSDQQWESSFNAQNEQWQKNFDLQKEQWDKQFEYTKMSDDQKLAYNYIVAAAANGGDVSDDLLARAGLSRADYNAMKAQAAAAGGGGGGGGTTPKTTTTPGSRDSVFDDLFKTNAKNTVNAAANTVQKTVDAINRANTTAKIEKNLSKKNAAVK